MPSQVRKIVLQATFNGGNAIPWVLEATSNLGIDARVSSCTFVIPYLPVGLTYDSVVQVVMGCGNQVVRFTGIVRDFIYTLSPRSIQVQCFGYLRRATEFENTEDPTVIGGRIPSDLTSGGTIITTNPQGYVDTADNIIGAVLALANVPYNPGNIDSSSIQYGLFEDAFVWKNGTNSQNFDLREAGESALSYIERYDEIDGDSDGRYRTYETSDGITFRKKMQVPPTGSPDIPPFVETVDLLSGQITRSISPTRNYFVVTGYDTGSGAGPEFFVLQSANSFQFGNTKHTAHLSSEMIERSLISDPGTGQSCEALCNALKSELNREIVTGTIETWRDDTINPLIKVQVQGNGGQADRLGTGQLLLVTGVTTSVNSDGFTQRLTLLG